MSEETKRARGPKLCALLLVCTVGALAAAASSAAAKPVQLDPSFGTDGRLTAISPEPEDLRLAEARNGDLLVAAGQFLTAYLPTGRIDRRFGEGGSASIVSSPGTRLKLGDLAVDTQGRPVVFGTLENIDDFAMLKSYIGGTIDSSVAAVLRFTPTGAPDSTFGSNGIVRTDLGLPYAEQSGKPVATAAVGFVDPLDRPIFAGGKVREVGDCGHGHAVRQDEMVVRLTSTGAPDVSFGGGDGIEPIADIATMSGLVAGRDGETMVAASTPATCEGPGDGRVVALSSDGSPEMEFATAGTRDLPGMSTAGIAIDLRGRILVLGDQWGETPVLRLKADGKVDRHFGRAGEAKVKLSASGQPIFLTTDRSNRVILAGTLARTTPTSSRTWLTATRLTSDGRLDRDFANADRVATAFGVASQPRLQGALIDRRGRLVIAGVNWNSRTEESGYGLVRYREGK